MLGIITAVARWVKVEEMLEVIEHEARLWPNTAALRGVSDGRERKLKRSQVSTFWIVVVDEIPGW